uniref:Tc1-like transposase DDE domain-containing protein n=1 Tax=Cyprinus carpio carpio TaxID=630221 RepID=A0A9J7XDV8_CYPCA
MHSILGRESFCRNDCFNAAWHGGNQPVALLRCYGGPGCFDSGLKLIQSVGSCVSQLSLHNIPQILYGVQVRRVGRPIEHSNTMVSKPFTSGFGTVSRCQAGLQRSSTGLLLSGPKYFFRMKANFACHSEIKVPESEGKWGEGNAKMPEVQCQVPTVSDGLGCHVSCWCWSTVFLSRAGSMQLAIRRFLEHFMLPSAEKLYGDEDFVFQHDLAPAHSAKTTGKWFTDQGITVLNWPANSPDLNPIENLWDIVKRKLRDTRPNTLDELKAAIEASWASITPQQCHRLIASMPRRIEAVISAKGFPTKY